MAKNSFLGSSWETTIPKIAWFDQDHTISFNLLFYSELAWSNTGYTEILKEIKLLFSPFLKKETQKYITVRITNIVFPVKIISLDKGYVKYPPK